MLYQLSYRLVELLNADQSPEVGARFSQISTGPFRCYNSSIPSRANVAELADALDLGSSARKGMGVRPSPFAPKDLDLTGSDPRFSIQFLKLSLLSAGTAGTSPSPFRTSSPAW